LRSLMRPPPLFRRVLQLRVVADDGFVLPVQLAVERGDGVRRVRDHGLELRDLLPEAGERLTVAGNTVAQLFDLALGLENAPRVSTGAPRHQMRTAEDIAVRGTHCERSRAGCRRRHVVRR